MRKREKEYSILSILLPGIVIAGFAAAGLFLPDQSYSESERRVLAKRPELTIEGVINGRFMADFDSYTLDQFVGRDVFRSIKAGVSQWIFRQKDNNGLYLAGGHISKLEYPMNLPGIQQSLAKQQAVYDTYLKGTDCRVYQSVIPDKNCFLAPEYGYPHIDYKEYVQQIQNGTPYAEYIDIFDLLSLDDFYRTDQHWKQECIVDVAERIGSAMGAEVYSEYREMVVEHPFYGAYYAQAALPHEADTITYLTNELLESCTVVSFNTGAEKPAKMYDLEKAQGRDPYEMFLSGSDALLVIERPESGDNEAVREVKTGRELVVFRDSFGSSLVPLLVPGYDTITVVDLRYLKTEMIGNYVEFEDQDVLFIGCTLV